MRDMTRSYVCHDSCMGDMPFLMGAVQGLLDWVEVDLARFRVLRICFIQIEFSTVCFRA